MVQMQIDRAEVAISATANRSARAYPRCGFTTSRAARVYFKRSGLEVLILLAGGDKSTQGKDIKTALKLARELSE
ncbi:MAG: type II toxin-antitoxin system RelE/ParE family toxin [Rhodocyclaceae bacterium]|nr:type II toxin-antitoxin system RelE/ParE family toxin [Rhodocyclaceae bacterium]